MKTPHKHADTIKAWADGAEIEFLDTLSREPLWREATRPTWNVDTDYRVKPEPEPDLHLYPYAVQYKHESGYGRTISTRDKLKLTFDGETGKLKSAEVL